MPFQNENKQGRGRPKGSSNKLNDDVRKAYRDLVQGMIPVLEKDLKKMKPNERVNAIIKLSQYILPRLQSVEVSNESEMMKDRMVDWSDIEANLFSDDAES